MHPGYFPIAPIYHVIITSIIRQSVVKIHVTAQLFSISYYRENHGH